jgi:hypothetical protein
VCGRILARCAGRPVRPNPGGRPTCSVWVCVTPAPDRRAQAPRSNRPVPGCSRRRTSLPRRSSGRRVVSIADTGRGIAPEDLPFVFDRYWRPKGSKVEGTGLGGILRPHATHVAAEPSRGQQPSDGPSGSARRPLSFSLSPTRLHPADVHGLAVWIRLFERRRVGPIPLTGSGAPAFA